jgi:hypothetical protein
MLLTTLAVLFPFDNYKLPHVIGGEGCFVVIVAVIPNN